MLWSLALGLFSAAAKYAVKALDYFKFKQEVQVDRRQDEIMMTEQPKSETVKKLEDGTF